MTALVAYLAFLSRTAGWGGNDWTWHRDDAGTRSCGGPLHGARESMKMTAATNHKGQAGAGQRSGKEYSVPPLWGADSFNDGAGMGRLITAANFIHNNMPFGTTWGSPTLSSVDAWDVAAFLESQSRPQMAHLAKDLSPTNLRNPWIPHTGLTSTTCRSPNTDISPFASIRLAIGSPWGSPSKILNRKPILSKEITDAQLGWETGSLAGNWRFHCRERSFASRTFINICPTAGEPKVAGGSFQRSQVIDRTARQSTPPPRIRVKMR